MVLDSFNLDGKIAVITGGGGLLGAKHAEAILECGGIVILLDINDEALQAKKNELDQSFRGKVFTFKVDITDEAAIIKVKDEIYNKFGETPEILINNAAIDPKMEDSKEKPLSRLENFSVIQWDLELAVGLTGAMLCSKVFGYEMSISGGGAILNIASDLGVIAPDQRIYKKDHLADSEQNVKPITYSVIKHGLIGMTKYLATYWADKEVRCNAFAPGGVFNNHPEDFLKKLTDRIPMQRMAKIDEYKAAIVFMCSDASSYMNGAVLNMDGGRTTW